MDRMSLETRLQYRRSISQLLLSLSVKAVDSIVYKLEYNWFVLAYVRE